METQSRSAAVSKAKLCGTSGPPVPSSGVWVVTHGLPSRRKRAPPGRSPSSFCALIVHHLEGRQAPQASSPFRTPTAGSLQSWPVYKGCDKWRPNRDLVKALGKWTE